MTNENFALLLLPHRQMTQIKNKQGIELKGGIEGNNQVRQGQQVEERREK